MTTTLEQIAALTPDEACLLTAQQLTSFSAAQAAALSLAAISSLAPNAVKGLKLDEFDSAHIAALLPEQFNSLTSQQLNLLSAQQVAGITGNISEMTRSFHFLSAAALTGLTTSAVTQIEVSQLQRLSFTQLASFTAEQVNHFKLETKDLYTRLTVQVAPTGSVLVLNLGNDGMLTTINTLSDSNGVGSFSYAWLRNDKAISNATLSTYKLSGLDNGTTISVEVSYTDRLGKLESVTSNMVKIENVNNLPTGFVLIKGDSVQGQILTASNTLADLDGLGAVSYQWLNAGLPISGANKTIYTLTPLDVGKAISVNASYTDLLGTAESIGSSATALISVNKNTLPTGTVSIKGLATWGTTLTIANTIKDADGLGKLSYTWQNDKGALSNKSTYTLVDSDVGKKIWVAVSYTDKKNNFEVVKSNVVDVTVSNKSSAVNDILLGTDKANKLLGLAGNDTLIGGLGKDTLTGGDGADVFKFNSVNESSVIPKQADTITDFKHAQGDKIDLSAIDVNLVFSGNKAFTFIGTATFSADATGQLRFEAKTSMLYGSSNADPTPEFVILLSGIKGLVAGDLIL